MTDRDELARRDGSEEAVETETRVEEAGEADEADAPTAQEENVGMSSVLDADPLFGVQDDASDK